ncbi:MAG: class I SAM-dependent methyltransferase [Vicinamibacterales bacterium]
MSDGPAPRPSRDDHYSYAAYADPRMAETFDTARFSGPIGRMLADTQEQVITSFLAPLDGQTVLDVGTGTGRAAIALARRGAVVTGLDASVEMLAVAERRASDAGARVTFVEGDAHALGFPSCSFDAVVCLRVLMHMPDWRRSLRELCRVARQRVVLDYPAVSSAASLQAIGRHVAHRLGARVEAYRVFSDRSFRAALRENGFRLLNSHRQFVLPIAFHKKLGSASATSRIEGALDAVGLRRMLGSPVTIVAERAGGRQEEKRTAPHCAS